MEHMPGDTREMGWRVPASILIGIGWLVFLIIWLFFYASDYGFWRNLGIMFASLIIALSLEAAIWVGYGMRMGERYSEEGQRWMAYGDVKWRTALSVIVSLGWSVFFIIWLIVYAGDYSGYQNLAVLLVSVLIAVGVTAAMWAGIRRRY